MQFRDFGMWIDHLANGRERLVVFGRQADVNDLAVRAAQAKLDRFRFVRVPNTVPKGKIFVVPESAAYDVGPLIDALDAAYRADLHSQLLVEQIESFERGGPSSFRFEAREYVPEQEMNATHPDGEGATVADPVG